VSTSLEKETTMKDGKYLTGVLTGVALTLALVAILMINQPRPVLAETGKAGAITAVSERTTSGYPMLFVVDSQEQMIMTYLLQERKGRQMNALEFVSARSFEWDRKAGVFNNYGATVSSVREAVLKKEEMDEEN